MERKIMEEANKMASFFGGKMGRFSFPIFGDLGQSVSRVGEKLKLL